MKIYHYSPVNGALLGSEDAFESPLEPGVYIIPAHATQSPPPETIPVGFGCFFNGQAWSVKSLQAADEPVTSESLTDEEILGIAKARAKQLLIESDWSCMQDVLVLLDNHKDFVLYRAALRAIFLNPTKDIEWPVQPAAKWLL